MMNNINDGLDGPPAKHVRNIHSSNESSVKILDPTDFSENDNDDDAYYGKKIVGGSSSNHDHHRGVETKRRFRQNYEGSGHDGGRKKYYCGADDEYTVVVIIVPYAYDSTSTFEIHSQAVGFRFLKTWSNQCTHMNELSFPLFRAMHGQRLFSTHLHHHIHRRSYFYQ